MGSKIFVGFWTIVLAVALAGTLITMGSSYLDTMPTFYPFFSYENGVWENTQALSLFFASIIMGGWMLFFSSQFPYWYSFIIPVILSCVFFVGAGEEVGWGIRELRLLSPEEKKVVDTEHPPVLHEILGQRAYEAANNVLKFFLFSLFGIFPFLAWFSKNFKQFASTIGLPIVPLIFVPFVLFGGFYDNSWFFIHVLRFPYYPPQWSPSELRETLFALGCLGMSIYQFLIAIERKPLYS